MPLMDLIVTLLVLLGLFIIVYTKVKNQEIKDTIEEIKDTLNPVEIIE